MSSSLSSTHPAATGLSESTRDHATRSTTPDGVGACLPAGVAPATGPCGLSQQMCEAIIAEAARLNALGVDLATIRATGQANESWATVVRYRSDETG